MLSIKSIVLKNFMSIGAVSQSIVFDSQGLSLVLGENIDLGGGANRNGVGKSSLLNAISFGLFGQPIANIRIDNLINRINSKNMSVSIEFEKQGHKYKIERGRKPNYFRFIVDDHLVNKPDTNEAQGETKNSQDEIERILGFNHVIFKNLIGLNTKTEHFLNMGANKQRELIELLLGITQLSQKADSLKELQKDTKNAIEKEEIKIKTIKDSNDNILRSIEDIERKAKIWERNHSSNIQNLKDEITNLNKINIEQDIVNLEIISKIEELERFKLSLTKEYESENRVYLGIESKIKKLDIQNTEENKQLQILEDHKCFACGQEIHDDKNNELIKNKKNIISKNTQEITDSTKEYQEAYNRVETLKNRISDFDLKLKELGPKPKTYYKNIDSAYEHKTSLEKMNTKLENEKGITNPYLEQIETLKQSGLQEVSYALLNELTKLKEHQEFLFKLLTSKDSFIRKKIIDQNLNYLNFRLRHYLDKLGLPHEIKFLSDLNVNVTYMGRESDYDNLSTGEQTRVILGLSFAFRDVYESLNEPINLIFIDEILDVGLDPQGVEHSLELLKKFTRERKKDIFLVSHRDELISRVQNVLHVIKENGFTTFSTSLT